MSCEHIEVCDCCDVEPGECGYYAPKVDRSALERVADFLGSTKSHEVISAEAANELAVIISSAIGEGEE